MTLPVRAALVVLGAVAAFFGYFGMAKSMPINADGASNALQAWDMLHGNPILRGWTVTDVSFYSTELIQYALIELIYGFGEDTFRIAAAMTYTLLVILAAALAKGKTTGLTAFVRMGIAVAIIALPMPGTAFFVAFGGPNHLGTGVPLLLTWLVLDKAVSRKWLPILIGLMLAWGQIADPLVLFIGVLPLALVGFYRAIRARDWKGLDAQLVVAAVLSVPLGQGTLKLITALGGFGAHKPPTDFAPPAKWLGHLRLLADVMTVNFGGYLPDMNSPTDYLVAILRLAGLGLALAAVGVTIFSLLRKPLGDRVSQILAVAILINLAAFIASTLPTDLMSARQVAVVLPMGAALAGRVCAGWFPPRRAALPLAAVLALFSVVFVFNSFTPPYPEPKREIVAWLESKHLTHGLGSYWNANDLTLIAGGNVVVAPITGGDEIKGYRWESDAAWYDPALHDARFLILDTARPGYGTLAAADRQFGTPIDRQDFGQFTVLVYDHNLLANLKAECGTGIAPSMSACPPH
ncbi:hypothetical protein Rhe02_97710 [Rhizocola hellebori]|uniref:Uncharacterized protein n=1 Tax=Rhizocola hellebori TaxID=1392758 RepID=A0A8J3QKX6_9ACTN|nr:hypothetical protein [Rhizocola hellebori]GIH11704.1 hypothetical protein Rhe02_97710 [Rhizocola hellebori]